jgi:hypothetical protein
MQTDKTIASSYQLIVWGGLSLMWIKVRLRGRNSFRLMSALGHVWTARWQELSDVAAALVGCGHVSGLFVRRPVGAQQVRM